MSLCVRLSWGLRVGVWAAVLAVPGLLLAIEPAKAPSKAPGETVELFAAMEAGSIEAKLIPRDSTQVRLLVTNKTDRPLSVAVPAAFAAVPVLGQIGLNNPFNQGNNQGFNNAPQRLGIGGPMGGPGMMNMAGPGMGGPQGIFNIGPGGGQNQWFQGPGIFNIPPEKVGKLKLKSVCLDFGKPEPRPKFSYEIRPLDKVSDTPGLAEVCATLGADKVPQRVAQLAAWHLASGKSWENLAGLREKTAFATRPRYSPQELAAARKLAEKAVEAAKKAEPKGGSQSGE